MAQELLGDLVREGKQRHPSRLALIWHEEAYSYLTLDGMIDQAAEGFLRQGVLEGDRIAFYMHNLPHFVIAFYALERIGAIVVPINIYWKDRDLHYMLAQSRVKGVITIGPYYQRVLEAQVSLPEIEWVVAITANGPAPTDAITWPEILGEPLSEPIGEVDLDAIDPAIISFTGGRSGPSRPAVLSHFNLLANCQQMQDLPQVSFWGDDENDEASGLHIAGNSQHEIALLPLPLFNLFSLNTGLNLTYKLGGTAVLMERFDPVQALDLIDQHHCTVIYGSPATFSELVNTPEFAGAQLGSLRHAFSYGAPLPAEVSTAWQKKTNCPLFNCYGLTEAAPVLACQKTGPDTAEDMIGTSLPLVELTLLGAGGEQLPAERVSELLVRGPNLMLGYFNAAQPEELLAPATDGWFATDDLALFRTDGNFELIDRKEDVLMLKGNELVVPLDIERVLLSHNGIWEATALPYTTSQGRNRMIAFVVLNEAGRKLTPPQLSIYCEKRMPIALCPERIFIYREEALPRLPNGAVWRRALRLQISQYL